MGSGSYVDLVVIKPKDDVQYLRTFDEANVKVYLLILSRINSNFDQRCHQGERREKYTYPKGATAVLSEKVREIKVRQVGGSQVSFHGFLGRHFSGYPLSWFPFEFS